MKHASKITKLMMAVTLALPVAAFAGSHEKSAPSKTTTATETNFEVGAMDQGTSEADQNLTRKIRRDLMSDDSLSVYAQNVTIVTRDGVVTLQGQVRSEREKSVIQEKARKTAGVSKVVARLDVMAK